jgi:hypothetical protein
VDKRAKNILLKTYWSAQGWKGDYTTEPDDFEYAKSKGLMFDSLTISKEELILRLNQILINIPLKKVTDAFLCSLTNNRLDWRSGLASFANAKRLLENINVDERLYGHGKDINLNVLNFERIKWGGVRHQEGLYNLLDLELLQKEIVPSPTKEDIEIFKKILHKLENADANETPSVFRDNLKDVFNKSKNERAILMEILGCAEIIKALRFDRKIPAKYDWRFILHWRGEDKYNKTNLKMYFRDYNLE